MPGSVGRRACCRRDARNVWRSKKQIFFVLLSATAGRAGRWMIIVEWVLFFASVRCMGGAL